MSEKLFNPLAHPACLEYPLWLEETAWAGHVPFAMFLISALRPRVLVELGAYRGVSYCAFCQAVKTTKSDTKCYAVDTWQGDEHAGEIEDAVLPKLRAHHDPLYADFSRLVQSTFDDALAHFGDRTVDLLHIDGFHTYEAVSHDFKNLASENVRTRHRPFPRYERTRARLRCMEILGRSPTRLSVFRVSSFARIRRFGSRR
jgi:hypothetical protein